MFNSLIAGIVGILIGAASLFGVHEITQQPTPQPAPTPVQVPADVSGGYTPLGATNANSLETTVALFETTLANSLSLTSTTMTLTSATTKDGTTLASSTYAFIIDEGSASQEFVRADCTGTSCTNLERGISVLSGTTSVTALIHKHSRGASVKITTGPSLIEITNILNGNQSFNSSLLFNKILTYNSSPSFTPGSNQIPTVAYAETYANNVIAGGAPTSTTAIGGKVRLATQQQMSSSTDLGSTAPLVLQAKYATSTFVVATSSIVITRADGKISPNAFATSSAETYNYGSNMNFNSGFTATASSTINATTTLTANIAVGRGLCLNGVCYTAPSSQGAAGSVLKNDGAGGQSWGGTTRYTINGVSGISLVNSQAFATSSTKINIPAGVMGASSTIDIYGNARCGANGGGALTCTLFIRNDATGQTFASVQIAAGASSDERYSFHVIIMNQSSVSSQVTYITGPVVQTNGTISSGNQTVLETAASTAYNLSSATTLSVVYTTSSSGNDSTSDLGYLTYIVNP